MDGNKSIDKYSVGEYQGSMTYSYYLSVFIIKKIVPTVFEDLFFGEYDLNQFTVNTNHERMPVFPAVYFKYDFTGVTVRVNRTKENFFHFLVQICAIIGGVFTLVMILDTLVYKASMALSRTTEMS